jgi:hypothetical protein
MQPSLSLALPSSHCSFGSMIPLPQNSREQSAEQPSPPTVFPSSQSSPASCAPFPQTAQSAAAEH